MKDAADTMSRGLWFLLFIVLFFSSSPVQAIKGQLGDSVYGKDHAHYFAWNATHPFKAVKTGTSESTQICIFCHTPHGASTAAESKLWNRGDPETTSFPLYGDLLGQGTAALIYNATTYGLAQYYNTAATYPNGASRLCMSCHDGISAIGNVLNGGEAIIMAAGGESISDAGGIYNAAIIDLAVSHPISFVYNAAVRDAINNFAADSGMNILQLPADPTISPLDSKNRMQCTTCHDPHLDTRLAASPASALPMWRYGTGTAADYDTVCQNCHDASVDYITIPPPGDPAGDPHGIQP